jgi:putative ABC transport system permease protein
MIKTQLLFGLREMRRMKLKMLVLLIQYTLTIIVMVYLIGGLNAVVRVKEEAKRIRDIGNVYYLSDHTPIEKFENMVSNKSNYIGKLKQINDMIYNENLKSFPIIGSSITMNPSSLKKMKNLILDKRTGQYVIDAVQTTDIFFDFFNLRFKDDIVPNYKKMFSNSQITPVIVGFDFSKEYKVGDVFNDSYGNQYVVAGIMDENMSYIKVKADSNFINLDNRIIIMVNPKNVAEITGYDSLICDSYIITSDTTQVKKIVSTAAKLNTYNFFISDMQKQFKYVLHCYSVLIQFQSFVVIMLLLFVVMNFTLSLIQYYRQNIFEIGIHLMSGATKADIFLRTVFRIAPIFIISTVVMFLTHKINSETITALGFSLIYSFVLCIISLYLLSGVQINSVLRSYRDE